MQHVIKTIMKSSAYGLSSRYDGEWKDSYTPYYARKYIRVLSGTEVVDAISYVTNRPGQYVIDGVRCHAHQTIVDAEKRRKFG